MAMDLGSMDLLLYLWLLLVLGLGVDISIVTDFIKGFTPVVFLKPIKEYSNSIALINCSSIKSEIFLCLLPSEVY